MSGVLDLARDDLKNLQAYVPGAHVQDSIRLNANESPWRLPSDHSARGLNIYPPPRPQVLNALLASHYASTAERLLVTRGSSEAIDVLIRGFCQANRDSIVICPPTFDMYRLYASIQGASIRPVPLDGEFRLRTDAVLEAIDASVKIVFICTPNNPTGGSVPKEDIRRLASELKDRALLVIDEAYYEFSSVADNLELIDEYDNVVILRTLSKFVALAGARCGAVLARAEVIDFLGRVLPPYTFPTPSIECVVNALEEESLVVARERIALIRQQRNRLAESLARLPGVIRVYPSEANFILVRVRDRQAFVESARRASILIRAFDAQPALEHCVRITVGRPEDNEALLRALAESEL
jgi:histidinol-phosphate aminotransferase